MRTYEQRFNAQLTKMLGGIEMATEFFGKHPEIPSRADWAMDYHRTKGGAAWKGACIFFRFHVKPILKADRLQACRLPIGADDSVDGRR